MTGAAAFPWLLAVGGLLYSAVLFVAGVACGRLDREERRHERAAARAREIAAARLADTDPYGYPLAIEAGQGAHRAPEPAPGELVDIDLGVMQPIGDPRSTWWYPHLARRWREGGAS